MRLLGAVPFGAVVLVLLVSATGLTASVPSQPPTAALGPSVLVPLPDQTLLPKGAGVAPAPHVPAEVSSTSAAFDRRVGTTAEALAAAGVPQTSIRLPYVGASAVTEDGALVPGYEVHETATPGPSYHDPAPSGVAYYGQNDTSGVIQTTTVDASSVAGSLTVNQLTALYLDVNTPDLWGIQLNSVLTNVTLQGDRGYYFWTQNAVDFIQHNQTLSFGEDTWNFSAASNGVPTGNSTILSHDPNGSVQGGIYIGEGPYVHAPLPFTLILYANSSVTAAGEQELWYNYSLAAAGGIRQSENYDWLVFNSTNSHHHATVGIAPFEASGSQANPVGLPDDFEFDFGIGSYDGSTMDVLAANATATLEYCPVATASCTSSEFASVPAAQDFGSETGETSSGLSFSWSGTTATATAGPFVLRGMWGYSASAGVASGSTPVTNDISISGSPDPSAGLPYVFVFFADTGNTVDTSFEWAPDTPTWYLTPGSYSYIVMLADYAEQDGTLVVGSTPTGLAVTLPYSTASGVYTPLWALDNSQLAGISRSGTGNLTSQYDLFNNPTEGCSACGGAADGNLSNWFQDWNDYAFPVFVGLLLVGTNAYVTLDHAVDFSVGSTSNGGVEFPLYLQLELVLAHHVTVTDDSLVGGWPIMFEIETLAGFLTADVNPFPQANLVLWNSTDDLVASNTFRPAWSENPFVSPDGLLLYGGTRNTVWGNTFVDGINPGAAPPDRFAGLAEAESGDLLYNNNFSVDNPTVYLPYDIYNDSCPDGYAGGCPFPILPTYSDLWNVSAQPASNVSATVNGFPLSGSVLGPTCSVQGGNFWNDYGNTLNPTGVLPFTNEYNYSAILPILQPGASAVEPSIRAGGDSLPLVRSGCVSGPAFPVTFHESGLPGGTPWSVRVNGVAFDATAPTIGLSLPNATYPYSVGPVAGFAPNPGFGSFTVDGGPVEVAVTFSGVYSVTFVETGLPNSTEWSVGLNNSTESTSGADLVFPGQTNGSLPYSIGVVPGYATPAPNGSVVVDGGPVNVSVPFTNTTPVLYPLVFTETGLAAGTNWSVEVGQVSHSSDGGANVTFSLVNGSYSYTVLPVDGYLPDAGGGTVSIAGVPVILDVDFSPVALAIYSLGFQETGLPTGTNWSVTVGGTTIHSNGGTAVVFGVPNGTYAYSVAAVLNYTAPVPSGSVTIVGMSVTVGVTFSALPPPPCGCGANTHAGINWVDLEWVLFGGLGGLIVGGLAFVRYRRRTRPVPPSSGSS